MSDLKEKDLDKVNGGGRTKGVLKNCGIPTYQHNVCGEVLKKVTIDSEENTIYCTKCGIWDSKENFSFASLPVEDAKR